MHDALQRIAGEAGEVLPRVVRGDMNGHPAAGWYWRPGAPVDGCDCRHCVAVRAGEDAYLGDHSYVASAELGAYITKHP